MKRLLLILFGMTLVVSCALGLLATVGMRSRVDASVQVTDYPLATCNQAGLNAALAAALADTGEARVTFAVCPVPAIITLTAQKSIDSDVIIEGNNTVALRGNGATRLFQVTGSGKLTLSRIVLLRGVGNLGGAVEVEAGGVLVADRTIFSNNRATGSGGAISASSAEITLTSSIFLSNTASSSGGALHATGGSTVITGTLFHTNTAGFGGGVRITDGSLAITNTTFTLNVAGEGGGVYFGDAGATYDELAIYGAHFLANSATGAGGGALRVQHAEAEIANTQFILNDGTYGGAMRVSGATGVVRGSIFNSNQATGMGGEGGGIYSLDADLEVESSGFISNTATGSGGAIRIRQSESNNEMMRVSNSTFTGNDAAFIGAAIYAFKTGAVMGVEPLILHNVTMHNNTDGIGSVEAVKSEKVPMLINHLTLTDNPQGIELGPEAAMIMANSVLQNPVNCIFNANATADIRYSLLSSGSCGTAGVGMIYTSTVVLGPLQDNGGGPRTRLPLPGAPIIDTAESLSCLPTDQRGVLRPEGAGCDMGATESSAIVLPTATPTPEPTSTPTLFPTVEDEPEASPDASPTHTPTATSTSAPTQTAAAATATAVGATQTAVAATATHIATLVAAPSGTPQPPQVYLSMISAPATTVP